MGAVVEKHGTVMNIGNFAGDYGGVGIVGSLIMLTLPMTDVSAAATICLSFLTLTGQAIIWYSKHLDRKARRRRFDGIAEILESKLKDKISQDKINEAEAETYLKFMEKLDELDKD